MQAVNYDAGWTKWGDMIKHSPAPFHRRRLILEMAKALPYQSALDVGCGNGEMLRALSGQNKASSYTGVDISAHVVEINRKHMPFEFEVCDVSMGSLPRKFDLIVCSEVIEHIANYHDAFAYLRNMCEAWLILTVPSGKVHSIDRSMGHQQHFSPASLCQVLGKHAFSIDQIWQWGFPFHTVYKYLINLFPEISIQHFSNKTYTNMDKFFAGMLTKLFYMNLKCWGEQLVVRARAV